MLVSEDITKMAQLVKSQLPILTNITTEAEYRLALELMDELIEVYSEHQILIEALSNTIARYEDKSVQFQEFNKKLDNLEPAVTSLKFLMDQHHLSTADFEIEIGSKNMVSQILSGKKRLSREHISRLASRFSVSPALFF